MSTTSPEAEKKLGKDLETFEQLPVKTKELEALQEKAEKTTGTEKAALHQDIRDKEAEIYTDKHSDAGENKIRHEKHLPAAISNRPKE